MKYLAAGKQRCCHNLWLCHLPRLQPAINLPQRCHQGRGCDVAPLLPSLCQLLRQERLHPGVRLQLISHVVEAKPNELRAGAWQGPGQAPAEHGAVGIGAFGMKIKETKAGPARWDLQGFEQSYGRMEKKKKKKPPGFF